MIYRHCYFEFKSILNFAPSSRQLNSESKSKQSGNFLSGTIRNKSRSFFFQGVCRVFSFSCSLCDVCDLCPRVLVCADLDNADNATCETLQMYVAKVRRISILVFTTKLKDATCPAALRSYQDVKVLPSPFKLGN